MTVGDGFGCHQTVEHFIVRLMEHFRYPSEVACEILKKREEFQSHYYCSEEHSLTIATGDGWRPVLHPDGEKGYLLQIQPQSGGG